MKEPAFGKDDRGDYLDDVPIEKMSLSYKIILGILLVTMIVAGILIVHGFLTH